MGGDCSVIDMVVRERAGRWYPGGEGVERFSIGMVMGMVR